MGGDYGGLPFKIELWDDDDRHNRPVIEEVIALASDFASACGAYDEAVKRRPGKRTTSVRSAVAIAGRGIASRIAACRVGTQNCYGAQERDYQNSGGHIGYGYCRWLSARKIANTVSTISSLHHVPIARNSLRSPTDSGVVEHAVRSLSIRCNSGAFTEAACKAATL